jgi:uncharacterized membrane protein
LKAVLGYGTLRAHTDLGDELLALAVQVGRGEEEFRAEIRPDASMSPRNLAVTVICLTFVCVTIGLGFLSMGLWLVLPFAGLEIFAVGVAVGYTIRRSADCEIISIQDAEVTVTKTNGSRSSRSIFPRYWTRVRLERRPHQLHRSRLVLGSHGRFVEIGAGTTDKAKDELAAALKQAIGTTA